MGIVIRRRRHRPAGSSLAAAIVTVALAACAHGPQRGLATGTLTVQGASGSVPIGVEIADTPKARRVGLMYRTALGRDSGMAFLWPSPVRSGFWMKNTLIPLSIAWWDQQRRILDVRDMAPCTTANCPLYFPPGAFVGAVEVNAGFFSQHGIAVGDHVTITR